MDLKELDRVDPCTHWYYQAKMAALRQAIDEYAPSALRIVDVGAGSGFFSNALAKWDSGAEVTCIDPNYPSERREKEGRLLYLKSAASVSGDVYLFIDVLEHVEDDVQLLREYTDSAKPGTVLLITVPAFMSLWSSHDVYLQHYRRYTLKELVHVAESADLEILEARYLFSSILPVAWMIRRLRRGRDAATDMGPTPTPLNWILREFLKTEHVHTKNKVGGLTAFIVVRVPVTAAPVP